jgi:hypothetical protein
MVPLNEEHELHYDKVGPLQVRQPSAQAVQVKLLNYPYIPFIHLCTHT